MLHSAADLQNRGQPKHAEAEKTMGCSVVVVASIMLTVNSIGEAQQQQVPSTPMSIAQAVESALRNYPSISVSQEHLNAAAAGIDLARTSYLPRVDSLAQVNRA